VAARARARSASSHRSSASRRRSAHGPAGAAASWSPPVGVAAVPAPAPTPRSSPGRPPARSPPAFAGSQSGLLPGDRPPAGPDEPSETRSRRSIVAVAGVPRMAATADAAALARRAASIGSSSRSTGTPTAGCGGRAAPEVTVVVGGLDAGDGTGVRRSGVPTGGASGPARRSAGPPRAGSAAAPANASSARVADRRGTASWAIVTRTSRGAAGRARRNSMRAAPTAIPSRRPRARNANSAAVTLSASLRWGSCRAMAPSG
jgi:hypothetical protein